MRSLICLAAFALAGGSILGCQDSGMRQEGDLATRTPSEIHRELYQPASPVPGYTTGDGRPQDMRTGGTLQPSDLTGAQEAQGVDRPLPELAPTPAPVPPEGTLP
jgi:hypothetical protein